MLLESLMRSANFQKDETLGPPKKDFFFLARKNGKMTRSPGLLFWGGIFMGKDDNESVKFRNKMHVELTPTA